MAADGRVTAQAGKSVTTFPGEKIERIGDAIYGMAGDYASGERFFVWARGGEQGRRPRLSKDFAALKLTKDGIYVIDRDDTTWMRCKSDYFAIGSGRDLALGAMAHGASPLEAVKTAMKWDIYSGGEPTVISLAEKH